MAAKITVASVGVAAAVAAVAAVLGWPLERAVYLAPVIVVCILAAAGLAIFWAKVAWAQLRETRRPRLWLAVWIGGLGLIALLSVLGVELPRE